MREDAEIVKNDHDNNKKIVELMEKNSMNEFTAIINIVVDSNDKYFTSDPYIYQRVFTYEEYSKMYEEAYPNENDE